MIYLDHSATTPIKQEVYEAMIPYLTTAYGNPSSKYYELALDAKRAVDDARGQVAKLMGAKSEEVIFTSGATESINMVIKGVADYKKHYEKKGNHIITSKVEHKATINTCKFLGGEIYSNSDATFSLSGGTPRVDRGYEVTFVDVNEYGQVMSTELEKSIRENTTIASIIWGNNEMGTLNDIAELCQICHKKDVVFHTDATQVFGKIDVDVSKLEIDFLSVSAHKVNGPKGIGAVYVKSDDYGLPPFSAFIHGGEQENGMRGSTLAVHDIVGFGKATEIILRDKAIIFDRYKKLDDEMLNMMYNIPNIRILGDRQNRLFGIYSMIVDKKDFNNERFLKKISKEFALSSGSACTAGQPSHVLQAMGLGDFTSKVIRISVGIDDKVEHVKALLEKL